VARIRTHELRTKSKQDLLAVLKELKTELAALRVAKVTGGASNKLSKIKTVRDCGPTRRGDSKNRIYRDLRCGREQGVRARSLPHATAA
jgi:ribosomal protein L29